MRLIQVKNITEEHKDWGTGRTFEPGEEFLVTEDRLQLYSENSEFLAALNVEAKVGDCSSYFESINEQINWLKGNISQEVTTQLEKNDKTLRMVGAQALTGADGKARFVIRIPDGGRKVAYGDAEFSVRTPGDRVTKIEINDIKRKIAWAMAKANDPEATEPLSDEAIRGMGYIPAPIDRSLPMYPVLDYYDERGQITDDVTEGDVFGGTIMTFQFGNTEVQPLGGYGNIPGESYLILEIQSAAPEGQRQGIVATVSLDWGEPNDE